MPFKKGQKLFLGKTHSEETRKRMSESHKGKPSWNKGLKGYKAGEKHHWFGRDMSGNNNPRYIEDRSKLQRYSEETKERLSSVYREWRQKIFKRDSHKCKIENKDCQGRIEAHHILPWRDYPGLRYEINNGITLCHAHHPKKRAEEKRLIPTFQGLVSVSKDSI